MNGGLSSATSGVTKLESNHTDIQPVKCQVRQVLPMCETITVTSGIIIAVLLADRLELKNRVEVLCFRLFCLSLHAESVSR